MFDLVAWWRDFTRAFKELKALSVMALLLVILDAAVILQWNDIAEMFAAEGFGDDWIGLIFVCFSFTLLFCQEVGDRYSKAMAKFAVVEMELEIDEGILARWTKVRRSCGILSVESRADIRCFPVELRFIQELEATRKMSKVGATRKELRARAKAIMCECLDPLAVELRVYEALTEVGREIVADGDALAQRISDIRDEGVEFHAGVLLSVT